MIAVISVGNALAATTHYIAANGSDSNNGTIKTTPWLHAPGMPNCSGTCASYTPVAGDSFILRGGDTWHFGNSSLTPYTGIKASGNGSLCDAGNSCGWSIGGPSAAWTGTTSDPIYFGVDQTWFSGSSWARPIMNGDNTPGTSGVSSCTYDQSAFSFIQSWTGSTNWIIDNFEFTGLCWSGANNTATYINNANHFANATTNRIIENSYFHGWTHVTFSCSAGPSGNCEAGWGAVQGPSASTDGIGDTIQYSVFDGSDTDEQSYSAGLFGMNIVQYNYVGFMAQGFILNNNHSFHDNLFDSINGQSDGQAHGNVVEMNTEFAADNVFYNNIIRNSFPRGTSGGNGCGNVQVWIAPTQTDYDFNNLIYGWNSACTANYWDMINASQGGTNGWTAQVFNNTWVMNNTDAGNPSSTTVNYTNNHCIIPGGGAASACFSSNGGTTNYTTNTVQTPTTATSQGYTSSETFAYSPTSGGSTIGAGTNETSSYCSALTGSGDAVLQAAGAACESGTGYACTYNASNHTVSCPAQTPVARPVSGAWDSGAYQFSVAGSAPNAPTGLAATVN